MASFQPKLEFEQFADDLIYEILSYLPIEDIIRSRQVCKRLEEATHQRIVWSLVYQVSKLLLPEGPTSTQTAQDLEDILVHAAKIQRRWSIPSEAPVSSRKFIDGLPAFEYDVTMISGRYPVVATSKKISWYDLDGGAEERLDIPIATYEVEEPGIIPAGMQLLSAQVNANNEGLETAYTAFVSNSSIIVLKYRLPPSSISIEVAATFPGLNYFPVGLVLGNDFVLAIKEFHSDTDPMDLFHIPTKRKYLVPMHARVHNLSDLNYVNYMITSTHLVMTFPLSVHGETEIEIFRLPTSFSTSLRASRLEVTHKVVYPAIIWKAVNVFEPPRTFNFKSSEERIGILATCYEDFNNRGIGGKTSLRYFDIVISSIGAIEISNRSSSVTHAIKPQTTNIFVTSSSTACLAVTQTYTMQGSIFMTHEVSPGTGTTNGNIIGSRFTLAGRNEGPALMAFDGFRGRLLINTQGAMGPQAVVWSMI